MNQHIKNKHQHSYKFTCFKTQKPGKKCKLQTDSKNVFITHNVQYHDEEPADDYSCQKCNKTFAGKSLLTKHLKHAMCDIVKHFQCPHCWRKYKTKQKLDKHILVHFPKTKCNICGLLLSRDKDLIFKQMNMHFCSKKYKKPRYFKRTVILQKRTRELLQKR